MDKADIGILISLASMLLAVLAFGFGSVIALLLAPRDRDGIHPGRRLRDEEAPMSPIPRQARDSPHAHGSLPPAAHPPASNRCVRCGHELSAHDRLRRAVERLSDEEAAAVLLAVDPARDNPR